MSRLHVQETAIPLKTGEELLDVDLTPSGEWVAVFNTPKGQQVTTPSGSFLLPAQVRYPRIRCVASDRLLIVDSRTRVDQRNGWLLDYGGRLVTSFRAGDDIEDIFSRGEYVILAYGDEGVLGGVPPETEGVAVFDTSGTLVFGYNSRFRENVVPVTGCYCGCCGSGYDFWFLPDTDLPIPLVCLDVEARTRQVLDIPRNIAKWDGAYAIVKGAGQFYFWDGEAVLGWTPGEDHTQRIGTLSTPGSLRGLPDGRFIDHSDNSFTIVSVIPDTE